MRFSRAPLIVSVLLSGAMSSRLLAGEIADTSRGPEKPRGWLEFGVSYGVGNFDDVSRYRTDLSVPFNQGRASHERWELEFGARTRHLSSTLSLRYAEKQSPTADSLGLDYFAYYSTVRLGAGPIISFFHGAFAIPLIVGFAHELNHAETSVRASGNHLFDVNRNSNGPWAEVSPTVHADNRRAFRFSCRIGDRRQASPSLGAAFLFFDPGYKNIDEPKDLPFSAVVGIESSWRPDHRQEFMVYAGVSIFVSVHPWPWSLGK
jgi:hypothetical protein